MATEQDQYLISVAAEMLGMHPQTLRKYERLGLIQPSRTVGSQLFCTYCRPHGARSRSRAISPLSGSRVIPRCELTCEPATPAIRGRKIHSPPSRPSD